MGAVLELKFVFSAKHNDSLEESDTSFFVGSVSVLWSLSVSNGKLGFIVGLFVVGVVGDVRKM